MNKISTHPAILAITVILIVALPSVAQYHSADSDGDQQISLSELLRVVQFFNVGSYHTQCDTEDNFAPGDGSLFDCDAISEVIMLPGDVPLEMVWVPRGTFMMGRYPGEQDSHENEDPQHQVTVSGFWMGKYEVTQAQWEAVMLSNPSKDLGATNPRIKGLAFRGDL